MGRHHRFSLKYNRKVTKFPSFACIRSEAACFVMRTLQGCSDANVPSMDCRHLPRAYFLKVRFTNRARPCNKSPLCISAIFSACGRVHVTLFAAAVLEGGSPSRSRDK